MFLHILVLLYYPSQNHAACNKTNKKPHNPPKQANKKNPNPNKTNKPPKTKQKKKPAWCEHIGNIGSYQFLQNSYTIFALT